MSEINLEKGKEFEITEVLRDIQKCLERTIEKNELRRGQKLKFHNALQNEIAELAKDYGLSGEKELLVENYIPGRNGYIDVVWKGPNGNITLFEIDSSPRVKSIKKLLAGDSIYKIWIYYGVKDSFHAINYDKNKMIRYIHFPILFQKD